MFRVTQGGRKSRLLMAHSYIFPPGGTSLYKLYRHVSPYRVGFLRRFGLKTGIHFAHFGLESRIGLRELRERMNVVIFSIPNE